LSKSELPNDMLATEKACQLHVMSDGTAETGLQRSTRCWGACAGREFTCTFALTVLLRRSNLNYLMAKQSCQPSLHSGSNSGITTPHVFMVLISDKCGDVQR